MKKLFAAMALATAITACTPIDLVSSAGNAPAPLQQTVIDEKGLLGVWSGFEVTLASVDALKATGVLVEGTPRALEIKGYLTTAQVALNAATAAQKAGSTQSYITALAEFEKAMKFAAAVLKGN